MFEYYWNRWLWLDHLIFLDKPWRRDRTKSFNSLYFENTSRSSSKKLNIQLFILKLQKILLIRVNDRIAISTQSVCTPKLLHLSISLQLTTFFLYSSLGLLQTWILYYSFISLSTPRLLQLSKKTKFWRIQLTQKMIPIEVFYRPIFWERNWIC